MSLAAVLTDLDGTLLEPDGSIAPEALAALAALSAAGVPVCLVSSKTPSELAELVAFLGLATPAGFENGAGVRLPGGALELLPAAVPATQLLAILDGMRRDTGAPARALAELGDGELSAVTGLAGRHLVLARARVATLPLLVEESWDAALARALPAQPRLRLLRGNRFLHLQGDHDKANVVARLRALVGERAGVTVACGDSANDVGLLAAGDVRVIVPSAQGPHPELLRRFPEAVVAPLPHGRGWAASLRTLLTRDAA